MMLIQKIFSKHRHRKTARMWFPLLLFPLYLYLQLLQTTPISALYMSPQPQPQQQMPEFANNPALVQSLNQMVAQQVAGGVPSGQLQVSASTGPNGVVSLASSGGGGGNIISNQTTQASIAQMAMATGAAGSSAQVAANAAANPAAQGNSNQFVIKWIHNDSKNGVAYVSITPVNHTNLHEPRIELRYTSKHPWVSIPESSANNTLVALVLVQDEDSGPNGETSLSIEHGNELGHFKLISTSNSNSIQVNGAPLSRQRVPEYNLTIVARDHGSPPKSSSTTLVIKLQPSPVQIPPMSPTDSPSIYGKPPVTDLMYVGTMLVLMFAAIVILIIFGCALVQRPTQKPVSKHHSGAVGGGHHHGHTHHHHHHPSLSGSVGGGGGVGGSHKSLVPAPRTSSAANSRIIPPPPPPTGGPANSQCSAYCLTSTGGGGGPGGYNRTNL